MENQEKSKLEWVSPEIIDIPITETEQLLPPEEPLQS